MRIDSPYLVSATVISGSLAVTGTVNPGGSSAYDLGSSSNVWRSVFSNAFSGSLTKLTDGSSYLVAGTNVGIVTSSNGSVTISSTATGASYVAGSDSQIQFNNGGNFGASSGLTFNNSSTRLGIGTSSPRATLDVTGGGSLFDGSSILTSDAYSGTTLQFGYQLATTSSITLAPTTSLFGAFTVLSEFDMTNGSTVNAFYAVPKVVTSTAGQTVNQNGVSSAIYRSYAGDLSTNANMRGSTVALYMQSSLGSNTTQTAYGFNATLANNKVGHTLVSGSGAEVSGIAAGPITTFTGFNLNPITGAGTISTLYGLRLQASTTPTITSRWGISQEDSSSRNYFAGKIGIGTSDFSDTLAVNGTVSVTGSILPGNNSNSLGSSTKIWSNVYASALSGSLTRLADGSSYLIAGNNITIATGSSGAVTISSTAAAGTLSGAGTTNYISKYSASTTLTDSLVYDNGSKIGIGTSTFYGFNSLVESTGSIGIQYLNDNEAKSLQFLGSAGGGRVLAKLETKRISVYGGLVSLYVARSFGGGGTQNAWKTRVFDDPASYPQQNTHTTFNVADEGGTSSSGVFDTAVVYIGSGSGTNNTRASLYAENDAWFAVSRGGVGIGTTTTNGNALSVNGVVALSGSVLPGTTLTHDLGSSTKYWRDLYARTGSFSGDVSITGNLTVLGTQTIISSSQVNIGDNIILLNSVANPQQYGGIYVADTTANTTGSLLWNSNTDRWTAGLAGSEINLVTTGSTDNLYNKTLPISGVDSNVISGGTQGGVGYFNTSGYLSSSAAGSSGQILQSAGTSSPVWVSLGSLISSSNSITGSGTTNYVSKFSSGNALTNSVIYDNGTIVGVGDTSATYLGSDVFLFVSGSLSATGTNDKKSVFGGDVKMSGSLLIEGDALEITGSLSVLAPTNLTGGIISARSSDGGDVLFVTGTLSTIGGRVGIGTGTPNAKLHVSSSYGGSSHGISIGQPNVFSLASNTYTSLQHTFYGGDGTSTRFAIGSDGNAILGGSLGFIANPARFYVTGSSDASKHTLLVKEGVASPTGGAGVLYVMNSDASPLLFVSGSGKVGIGTSTPSETFSVHSGGQDSAGLGVSGAVSKLYLGSTTTGEGYRTIGFDRSSGNLDFAYGNVGSVMTSTLTVDASGRIGIGTSTALTAALTVAGTVLATSLSGSLTRLADGTPYLLAGPNITITTGSNGSLSITGSATSTPGGSNTQVQFNDSGIFSGSSLFTFNKSTGTVTASSLASTSALITNITSSQVYVSGTVNVNGYIQMQPVGNVIIPTDQTAGYMYVSGATNDIYFSQYQVGSSLANTTRLRWLEGALTTGLLHGGVLSTESGSTTFSITSGSGIIVSYNASVGSEPYPTINFVSWPTTISSSITYITSSQLTYIGINTSGGIIQQITPFSLSSDSDFITIGRVYHQTGSVTNVALSTPIVSYGTNHWQDDFTRAFGPLKVAGHVLAASSSSGVGTLGLTKTAGDSYAQGRNYTVDPNNPNNVSSTSDTIVNVSKIYRQYVSGSAVVLDTGVANAGFTTIDPSKWNNNGTLSNVSLNSVTIQRVFWYPNSPTRAFTVYYGSAQYAKVGTYEALDVAQAALATEQFVEGDNTAGAAILVGYVLVTAGTTDLTDTTKARIIQAGISRGTGAGGGGGAPIMTVPPGGLDTYVQFNDGGSSFGGDSGLTYNKTTDTLTIGNISIGDTGVLSTTGTSATLFNTNATTVNFAGAATTLNIGNTAGTNTISGVLKASQGLSGSLTRLTDGSSYLIAGSNVSISTGSNGAITISSTSASGVVTGTGTTNYVSKWSSASGLSDSVIFDDGTNVGVGTSSTSARLHVVGSTSISSSVLLVRENQPPSFGTPVLEIQNSAGTSLFYVTGNLGTVGGRIGIGTNRPDSKLHVSSSYGGSSHGISIGQPNIFGLATNTYTSLQHTFLGGNGTTQRLVIGSDGNVLLGGSLGVVATPSRLYVTGSSTSADGTLLVKGGVPSPVGALVDVKNSDGTSLFVVSGSGNVGIGTATSLNSALTVNGTVYASALTGSLTKLSDGTSFLVAGSGIQITSGSSGQVTVTSTAITSPAGSDTQVQFNDGNSFGANSGLTYNKTTQALTASIFRATTGFSGSLTRLTDGTSFLVAGNNITISTGSSGAVTITGASGITSVNAGTGLTGGGSSGSVTLSIDDSKVATISGSTFTGTVKFNSGLSGSLTNLTDGTSYLVAGSNVTITTGSNGSVSISSSPPAGTLSGTGTTSYIPKYSGASTLANSNIYDDGTGIGIGSTSYSARLFVSGTSSIPTSVVRAGIASPTGAVFDVQNSSGTSLLFVSGSGEIGLSQNISSVQTATSTTTSTSPSTLLSVSSTIFRSAEFVVQGVDTTGGKYVTAKILAIHNGSTTNFTEYGSVNVGGIAGTFSVTDPSAGTFLLQVTPASTNSTTWKVTAILTKV